MNHHAVQNALVRMLYDPAFAEAVQRAPETTDLPAEIARTLAAIDPRALRADPLRRRRTLGTLVQEFNLSTTICATEARSLGLLEAFFSSRSFHLSVEERTPLALAYGDYLLALCDAHTLGTPRLRDIIRLESLQARARREIASDAPLDARSDAPVDARLVALLDTTSDAPLDARSDAPFIRLAPGVRFARFGGEVLDTVQRVERHLFSLSLLPQIPRCEDAPRLALPPPEPGLAPLALLTVPLPSGLTLVTADHELCAVIEPLAAGPLPTQTLLARAAATLGQSRAAALIAELLDDEVLAPASHDGTHPLARETP